MLAQNGGRRMQVQPETHRRLEPRPEEKRRTLDRAARDDGMLLCLEGAATIAAALRLRESGWIHDGERVLCINTGSPFKNTPPT